MPESDYDILETVNWGETVSSHVASIQSPENEINSRQPNQTSEYGEATIYSTDTAQSTHHTGDEIRALEVGT